MKEVPNSSFYSVPINQVDWIMEMTMVTKIDKDGHAKKKSENDGSDARANVLLTARPYASSRQECYRKSDIHEEWIPW